MAVLNMWSSFEKVNYRQKYEKKMTSVQFGLNFLTVRPELSYNLGRITLQFSLNCLRKFGGLANNAYFCIRFIN